MNAGPASLFRSIIISITHSRFAAILLFLPPATDTFVLSHFQRTQREERQEDGNDPEPHNDLGFRPSQEFKVVV